MIEINQTWSADRILIFDCNTETSYNKLPFSRRAESEEGGRGHGMNCPNEEKRKHFGALVFI